MRSPLNDKRSLCQVCIPTTAQQPLNVTRQQTASVYLWKKKATGSAMTLSRHRHSSSERLLFLLSFHMMGILIKVPSTLIPIVMGWACTLSHTIQSPFFWNLRSELNRDGGEQISSDGGTTSAGLFLSAT